MDEKHLNILKFLAGKETPTLMKDFPKEIKAEYVFGLGPQSLGQELSATLGTNKKWVRGNGVNGFSITEEGTEALKSATG